MLELRQLSMTANDAYKYARQLRRWAWRNKRGPLVQGLARVAEVMAEQGYSEQDYRRVKAWIKAWQGGRLHPNPQSDECE